MNFSLGPERATAILYYKRGYRQGRAGERRDKNDHSAYKFGFNSGNSALEEAANGSFSWEE